ncbi:MAG: hypothetical protein C5B43_04590 [Verrucomicrobia bacterium]|nr:MAG: hypothetical protein C5B43_04590 [Verrucomicrobiota bacterium]
MNFAQELTHWSERSCRSFLETRDIEFIESITGLPFETAALFDDKLYFSILESSEQLPISPQLYFYILLQKTFWKANINNLLLLDYTVFILTSNLKTNSLNNEFYIIDHLEKINLTTGKEQFFLRIELSNQILFLTGLFQDHLQFRKGEASIPFYEGIGSNQYNAAINHPLANKLQLKEVLSQLSRDFSHIRQSLNDFSENLMSLGEPFIKHWLL